MQSRAPEPRVYAMHDSKPQVRREHARVRARPPPTGHNAHQLLPYPAANRIRETAAAEVREEQHVPGNLSKHGLGGARERDQHPAAQTGHRHGNERAVFAPQERPSPRHNDAQLRHIHTHARLVCSLAPSYQRWVSVVQQGRRFRRRTVRRLRKRRHIWQARGHTHRRTMLRRTTR